MNIGTMTADLKKIFESQPMTQEDLSPVGKSRGGSASMSLSNRAIDPTKVGKPDPEEENLMYPVARSGTSLRNYPSESKVKEGAVGNPYTDDDNLISRTGLTGVSYDNQAVDPGAEQPMGKVVAKESAPVPKSEDPVMVTPARAAGITLKNYPVGAKGSDADGEVYKAVQG